MYRKLQGKPPVEKKKRCGRPPNKPKPLECKVKTPKKRENVTFIAPKVVTTNGQVDYKELYRKSKEALKCVLFENEGLSDILLGHERRWLQVARDRSFLLNRLLQYEKNEEASYSSDATDLSDVEIKPVAKKAAAKRVVKRPRKVDLPTTSKAAAALATDGNAPTQKKRGRKQKPKPETVLKKNQPALTSSSNGKQPQMNLNLAPPFNPNYGFQTNDFPSTFTSTVVGSQQTNISTEEITRQLQARKSTNYELLSQVCTSTTVPATMFSDEIPSTATGEPNYLQHAFFDDAMPTHIAGEECVPMQYMN